MIRPDSVKFGDKIGIVATGRKVFIDDISIAQKTFESWGLTIVLGENLFIDEHRYLAGTDDHRLEDLQAMLDREDIHAIICARGGYGTTRILDMLDFSQFKRKPKWVVGFSDVTALHLKLFTLGIESIHGTMPVLYTRPDSLSSIESIREILFGLDSPLSALPDEKNRYGAAAGRILGGNLSLIDDAMATSSEPATDGNILVIEEVGEDLYHIDRMLTHLKRAGKLAKLAGLVVGHVTDTRDSSPGFGETLEDIVLDKVSGYDYPVGFGFPIGHENPNIAWRHGAEMKLFVTEEGSLLQYDVPV